MSDKIKEAIDLAIWEVRNEYADAFQEISDRLDALEQQAKPQAERGCDDCAECAEENSCTYKDYRKKNKLCGVPCCDFKPKQAQEQLWICSCRDLSAENNCRGCEHFAPHTTPDGKMHPPCPSSPHCGKSCIPYAQEQGGDDRTPTTYCKVNGKDCRCFNEPFVAKLFDERDDLRARLAEAQATIESNMKAAAQHMAERAKMAEQIEELKAWKADATKVDERLCLQEIGEELGLKAGQTIADKVLPAIRKMKSEKAELKSELLTRDAIWLPAKDAEIEKLLAENAELKRQLKQEW
jgi:hypothetical protein